MGRKGQIEVGVQESALENETVQRTWGWRHFPTPQIFLKKKKEKPIVVPASCPGTCAAFPRPLGPIVSSLLIRALIFFQR